ncbi:hypothetical protein [Ferroacidibacillus organovorans]
MKVVFLQDVPKQGLKGEVKKRFRGFCQELFISKKPSKSCNPRGVKRT